MSLKTPALPSFVAASGVEKAALRSHTAREEGWYRGHKRYADTEAIFEDVTAGRLVPVRSDANLALRGILRNPELHERYPPYLLPRTASMLGIIGEAWREELRRRHVSAPATRLVITSLIRSEAAQQELVADPSKLANPDSTHCVGGAFDIDASGYYVITYGGEYAPVADPERSEAVKKSVGAQVGDLVSRPYTPPQIGQEYNPKITDALLVAADKLHQAGVINAIVEYDGTPNRCLHVATNPGQIAA